MVKRLFFSGILAAVFLVGGLNVSMGKAEAVDTWFYADSSYDYYVRTESIYVNPARNYIKADVKYVKRGKLISCYTYELEKEASFWEYSVKGSNPAHSTVVQDYDREIIALRDFCLSYK